MSRLSFLTLGLTVGALVGLCCTALAAEKRTFNLGDRTIAVNVEKLSPALEVSSSAVGKHPAVDAYLRYHKLLGQGEIAKAAALSTAPDDTEKKLVAHQERIGGPEVFRKQMAAVLTDHLHLTHVIVLDDAVMVVGQHPDHGLFAEIFACEKGACRLERRTLAGRSKDLGDLFGKLHSGALRL